MRTSALPFQPQTIEAARARLRFALERVWIPEEVAANYDERPGQHAENVFDLDDGSRLIVSVDRIGAHLYLHVSGSGHIIATPSVPERFARLRARVTDLFEVSLNASGHHLSQAGIPHLYFSWLEVTDESRAFAA